MESLAQALVNDLAARLSVPTCDARAKEERVLRLAGRILPFAFVTGIHFKVATY